MDFSSLKLLKNSWMLLIPILSRWVFQYVHNSMNFFWLFHGTHKFAMFLSSNIFQVIWHWFSSRYYYLTKSYARGLLLKCSSDYSNLWSKIILHNCSIVVWNLFKIEVSQFNQIFQEFNHFETVFYPYFSHNMEINFLLF